MNEPVALRLDVWGRREWFALHTLIVGCPVGVLYVLVSRLGFGQTESIWWAVAGGLAVGLGEAVADARRDRAEVLTVDAHGFTVRRPGDGFTVGWAQVSRVVVSREKHGAAWRHFWRYRLEWQAGGRTSYPHLRDGDSHTYRLGRLGRGKRLYAALRRFGPATVELTEVRRQTL